MTISHKQPLSVDHRLRNCSMALLISGPGRDGSIYLRGLAVASLPTQTAPHALSAARNADLLSSICPVPMWRKWVPRLSDITFGALDLLNRTHFFGHGLSRSCHLPQTLHIRDAIRMQPRQDGRCLHRVRRPPNEPANSVPCPFLPYAS